MKLQEFRELVKKRPAEPFWVSRYFWRHITIPFSWLCSLLHIRADQITILSLVVGMVGGLCFCWPTPAMYIVGLILIQGWSFLDHVDGELARYEIKHQGRAPSQSGPYLDLLVHRWVQPFYHVCLSIGLLRMTGDWEWLLLGWLAGSNYFGFAKSQADSLVLRSLASGRTGSDNPALLSLIDLSNVIPTEEKGRDSKVAKMVNFAKTLKNWFAFPSCLVLICVVVGVDALLLQMHLPTVAGLPLNATVVYLMMQGVVALGQNIAGTWYVASLLKRIE